MKRFWDEAQVAAVGGGYEIRLDGKPVHLPGGAVLVVPSAGLAAGIAGEWNAAGESKGGEMSFADTPLTRLAGTAQERIAPDPEPTIDALALYAETELLCYRAEHPAALAQRQAKEWQPWLDWAALTYDAPLQNVAGVMHLAQNPDALRALRNAVATFDPWVLTGLGVAVPSLGSLILGLALVEEKLDAAQAHALANLDEDFQAGEWGRDPDAEKRRERVAVDIALAARFMALCRQ